jgi:hypothetical protein
LCFSFTLSNNSPNARRIKPITHLMLLANAQPVLVAQKVVPDYSKYLRKTPAMSKKFI